MRLKSDWASLIFGSKFTVFALFYLRSIFQLQAPGGAYTWRGDLTEAFLYYRFGGLIFGRAYAWRGLFSEFYGIHSLSEIKNCLKRSGTFLHYLCSSSIFYNLT